MEEDTLFTEGLDEYEKLARRPFSYRRRSEEKQEPLPTPPSQEKLLWVSSLKPGDVVCTCSKQHKEIAFIREKEAASDCTTFVIFLVGFLMCPPLSLVVLIFLMWAGGREKYEKQLFFADGTSCSALDCANPTDNCLHE